MTRAKPPASPKTAQQPCAVVAARRISPVDRSFIEEVAGTQSMKAANVISIKEYRNQETISTLEQLLEKARAGEVIGLAYSVCLCEWSSGVGATGTYRDSPETALGGIGRLYEILTKHNKRD
jgi:hypothetical protein